MAKHKLSAPINLTQNRGMDTAAQDALRELLDIRAALQDTIDYLERLPPVPATRHFCKKLRARLDTAPMKVAQNMRLELHGRGPYSPAGIPLMEATLNADRVLTVQMPRGLHGASRDYALKGLLALLKSGESIGIQLEERIGTAAPAQ